MNINSTIFIQIGNFFLAYLILRFFYFKPAAHALEKEQRLKGDLNISIATLQATIAAKQYEQKKHIRACQTYYEQHVPDVANFQFNYVQSEDGSLMTMPVIDQAGMVQLEQEIISQLTNRIDRV